MRADLSEAEALELLTRVVSAHAFPAALEFVLDDGRLLVMYDGDADHPRWWQLTPAPPAEDPDAS